MNEPTYRRIQNAVRRRIEQGEWRVGDAIPGEVELAQQFDCSRLTAHRALRELAAEGVIERRRRAGSRVAKPPSQTLLLDIPRIEEEVEEQGARYGYRRLSRSEKRTPARVRRLLELDDDERALFVLCLHLADERPYQLEERWIRLRTVPAAADEPFRDIGPNGWLLDHVPWTRAQHQVHAAAASSRVARHLEVEAGDPTLVLERRTWWRSETVTCSKLHHPSGHMLRSGSEPGSGNARPSDGRRD